MKKGILMLVTVASVAGALITSCSSSADKVKDAQGEVNEANEALDKANQEYLADIAQYRKDMADKIADNKRRIVELKAGTETKKQDAMADYKKKVTELEQRNIDMQQKIDDYKPDGKEKWELFKMEFSHSMDEVGLEFKELVNTK